MSNKIMLLRGEMTMIKKGVNLSNSIGTSFRDLDNKNKDKNKECNNCVNGHYNDIENTKEYDKESLEDFQRENLQDGEDF